MFIVLDFPRLEHLSLWFDKEVPPVKQLDEYLQSVFRHSDTFEDAQKAASPSLEAIT